MCNGDIFYHILFYFYDGVEKLNITGTHYSYS